MRAAEVDLALRVYTFANSTFERRKPYLFGLEIKRTEVFTSCVNFSGDLHFLCRSFRSR